jgi:mxaL protein
MQAPPPETPLLAGTAPLPQEPTGTEHLSSLKETHLRQLAVLTGLGYLRLQPSTDLAAALQGTRAAKRLPVPVDLRAPLAALALTLLVLAIGPLRRLPWRRRAVGPAVSRT